MIVTIVTLITSCLASSPLFSTQELNELEYLKSPDYFSRMRKKELQSYSTRQISSIVKMIRTSEEKKLEQRVNAKFWKSFDQYTDDQLSRKIMMDLILQDLYKKEGE